MADNQDDQREVAGSSSVENGALVHHRPGPLAGWGRLMVRWRFLVLGSAFGAFVVLALVSRVAGSSFDVPQVSFGAEAQEAVDLLEERFPSRAGDPATLIFQSDGDLRGEGMRERVEAVLQHFAGLPEVLGVRSPYETGGQISADGKIAYATLEYTARAPELRDASIDALLNATDELTTDELRLEVGGPVARAGEPQGPPGGGERIGLLAAAVILLIAFGSVVAMGLPLVTAVLAVGSSILILTLATRVIEMSAMTPAFVGMIGLGVGIDYALFIVTRYREELGRGASVEDAVGIALDTAGRAVIFAGAAVIIALLSLFVVGISFVAAIGVAGSTVVALSVLAALTVVPALLGVIGTRINRWRLGIFRPAGADDGNGLWYRGAKLVQRRPLLSAVLAAGLLLTLAAPVLDMRLGSSDAGNNPTSFRSRRAYDLLSDGFGSGFNGPLIIAVDVPAGSDPTVLDGLRERIAETPGVAYAAPPAMSPGGDAAVIQVISETSPQDEATSELIRELRDSVIPAALSGTGLAAFVGGQTAAFEDVRAQIASRLPLFFALVIGLSFVLLMVVFRSIAVPLKAAAMNLLAIGAAYGVLVAIFQWGWFAGPLGIGREGPIESFVPMMLFAILFGLSMDYEVFLLSRIRENHVGGASNSEAVAQGVGQTARVITAAAAIMVSVFLAFGLSEGRIIKEFGLGLATAIFVDATIVRLVLVPATMGLIGEANWWFPRWLDRRLPPVHIDRIPTAAPRS